MCWFFWVLLGLGFFSSPQRVLDQQFYIGLFFANIDRTCSLLGVAEKLPRFAFVSIFSTFFFKPLTVFSNQTV